MKKIFLILFFSFALILNPNIVLADSTDQFCYGNPFNEGRPVSIKYTLHGQVIKPTVNHITKIAIFAKSVDNTAKVKLKLAKAWFGWDMATYEKTIVLNNEAWWAEADFGEAPVTPGAEYLLTVEPLNDASIVWYIKDSADCNPNGYAFVGGNIEDDKDFYFVARGKNETTQLENPVEQTPEQDSTSGSAGSNSTINSDSNNGGASSNQTTASSQNNLSKKSPSSAKNNLVTNEEIKSANQIVKGGQTLSREEMEQVLKMIAEDYAKRDKGMFGLGGAVGSLLTPAVFYTIVGLILLIVVLLIVFAVKRKKKSNL